MVSVNYNGRFGNNLIQFTVSWFFAKKNFFYLNEKPKPLWNKILNFENINGKIGNGKFIINDLNFKTMIELENVPIKNYTFDGYFQSKNFFQKNEFYIKNLFSKKYEKQDKSNVFLHYRIGDISDDRRMLPLEYYEEALDSLNFKKGFISSDTIEHEFCQKLIKKYNLIPIINLSPVEIIDFGKNFNNIILSEGTFSWWIGFLSQAENIIYNRRDYFWHGDIFFDTWKKLSWDYDENVIYDNYKLKEYKPKKI